MITISPLLITLLLASFESMCAYVRVLKCAVSVARVVVRFLCGRRKCVLTQGSICTELNWNVLLCVFLCVHAHECACLSVWVSLCICVCVLICACT